jgi:hypothetical protein
MIRVSYRKDGDQWVGVLKDNANATIVECGHAHTNRGITTKTGGEAATVCARMILAGARRPQLADSRADSLRNAWQSLTSGAGFQLPAGLVESAKQHCAENAAAYLALVDQVRTHPDLNTTTTPAVPAAPTPETVDTGDLPDWML